MQVTPAGGTTSNVVSDIRQFTVAGGIPAVAEQGAVTCAGVAPAVRQLSASGSWTVNNPGTYNQQQQAWTAAGWQFRKVAFYAFPDGGGYVLIADGLGLPCTPPDRASGPWSYGPGTVTPGDWKLYAIITVDGVGGQTGTQDVCSGFSTVTVPGP